MVTAGTMRWLRGGALLSAAGLVGCAQIFGFDREYRERSGGSGDCVNDGTFAVSIVAEGEAAPTAIALDETRVYWTNEGTDDTNRAIRQAIKGAVGGTQLVNTGTRKPLAIAVDNAHVFWSDRIWADNCTDANKDRLMRAEKGDWPAAPWVLFSGCGRAQSVALQGSKVYLARPAAHDVQRMDNDGSARECLFHGKDTFEEPFSIAADGAFTYWTDTARNQVTVLELGGPTCDSGALAPQKFADALAVNEASWLAIDETAVYWTSQSRILKLDRTSAGQTPEELATDLQSPGGIALDDTYVYYTDQTAGDVWRACKSGGPALKIADNQNEPTSIAVDDSGVYWINHAGGRVMRAVPQ